MKTIDSVIISYDKEKELMIVGRKRPNESVEVINAVQGDEATMWWSWITKSTNEMKEEADVQIYY